jgi:hypothetical protein
MRVAARKLTAVGVGVVMTTAFAFAIPAVAGASVAADTEGACKALTNTGIDPSSIPDNPDDAGAVGRENADKLSKAFKKAARETKGATRKNFKKLQKYYRQIANGDTPSDPSDFAKANIKWVSFMLKCVTSDLPDLPDDIDIPDITIPGS